MTKGAWRQSGRRCQAQLLRGLATFEEILRVTGIWGNVECGMANGECEENKAKGE